MVQIDSKNLRNEIEQLLDTTEEHVRSLNALEAELKDELRQLLNRPIYPGGSQLLGLLMFDSDVDLAVEVQGEEDLESVLDILEREGYQFEEFTEAHHKGVQYGVCASRRGEVKIDLQLRSTKNIQDLREQIQHLPQPSDVELRYLRREKLLMRMIGGAQYVNWKHDMYRELLPALLSDASPRRVHEDMCISHDTLFGGQCTKRKTTTSFCEKHQLEE
ncbi:MAG: hypothetical protein VXY14_01830 [Candidatus Thermoplasmatota archaeon]|nr:hypothetical protein [Candidatus Thermoplasmatota archaeon]